MEMARGQILDAWVGFYRRNPSISVVEHSRALGDKLEKQLRALSRMRYHTTKGGLNRRATMRLVGMALGVHRQLVALAGYGKLPMSLT
ncbi:hypothetical protein ES708_31499 [subsurface metagenome]